MSDILTTQETVRLCELERTIQKGKDTFVEVGTALEEIRDARLYRPAQTFEQYCKDRWGFSRMRAHQLIESAKAVDDVKHVLHPPTNARQAAELSKAPPEKRVETWTKAQEKAKDEGKPAAARHVEEAVAEARWPKSVAVNGVAEEPKDSERISLLKSTWNKASKKEKVQFAAWINKNWKL